MARLRKNETTVGGAQTGSAAAPVRRSSAAPRKRAAAQSGPGETVGQTEEIPAATSAVSEAVFIEFAPSHDEISALAYSYWADRGYAEGCPEQDWLRAEAELRRRGRATE